MNIDMVQKLILKDWHLIRVFLLAYTLAGLLGLGLMVVPSHIFFNLGSILLITVIIGTACHLVIWSVVIEKKEYKLSFIMSLPIDALDYALSKLYGGILLFAVPWSILFIATMIVIKVSHLPDGLMPMIAIMFVEALAAYALLTAVAILTQSEAWTIVVMVGQNMMFSIFMMLVSSHPAIGSHIQGETAQWNSFAVAVLAGEGIFIVVVLALATLVKSRKKCFL